MDNVDTDPATRVFLDVAQTGSIVDLSVSLSRPFADDVDIFLIHDGVTVHVYDAIGDTCPSRKLMPVRLGASAPTRTMQEIPERGADLPLPDPSSPSPPLGGIEARRTLLSPWDLTEYLLPEPKNPR